MEILCWNENSQLCFDARCFKEESFNADDFISDRKKLNFEKLLDDLKSYYDSVSSEISSVLNRDYNDFLILSNKVKGINKHLKNVTSSLVKVDLSIVQMARTVEEKLHALNKGMEERNYVNKLKTLSGQAVYIFGRLKKLGILENDFSNLNMLFSTLEIFAYDIVRIQDYFSNPLVLKHETSQKNIIETLGKEILEYLNSEFMKSVSKSDTRSLIKILHMYSVLNKETNAENLFRKTFVQPYMQKHINDKNIEECGLEKVYVNVLNFMPLFCDSILSATLRSYKNEYEEFVPGYDFLVHAVWPEVILNLLNISTVRIYLPKDSQQFHDNYISTIWFLQQFELNCGNATSIVRLRKQSTYKEFIKKWNLDVYFHMRFIEIGGELETSLSRVHRFNRDETSKCDRLPYISEPAKSLWKCINYCWDDKIFIQSISQQFWKLTVQLISRYCNWTFSTLNKGSHNSMFYYRAAMVIVDTKQIIDDFTKLFYDVICIKVPQSFIEPAFVDSVKLLKNTSFTAENSIINTLSKKCCYQLIFVADISKLFRKTNRDVPTKPSKYAIDMVNHISEFQVESDLLLAKERIKYYITQTMDTIVSCWGNKIQDLLTSEKKIEESLKILNRTKNRQSTHVKSGSLKDMEKIRRQIELDIEFAAEFFHKHELNASKMQSLKDILMPFVPI